MENLWKGQKLPITAYPKTTLKLTFFALSVSPFFNPKGPVSPYLTQKNGVKLWQIRPNQGKHDQRFSKGKSPENRKEHSLPALFISSASEKYVLNEISSAFLISFAVKIFIITPTKLLLLQHNHHRGLLKHRNSQCLLYAACLYRRGKSLSY